MNTKEIFYQMMAEQDKIALATSLDDQASVRIVNFYYDDVNNIIYFTSYFQNEKVKILETNQKVAITTIPNHETEHIKATGIATRSLKTIYDLENEFTSKIPGYEDNIKFAGDSLILYEIKCNEFTVTIDMDNIGTISF